MNLGSFLLLASLFLTSCATITRGVHEKLKIVSEPAGANVDLSSGERGVTPATFVMRRKETVTVRISKPGYLTQTVKVASKFSSTGGTAMAGNVLAAGPIGAGVDVMSGATSSLYPNPVSVRLVPSEKPSLARSPASKPKAERRMSSPQASPSPKPTPRSVSTPAPTPTPPLRDAASAPGPEKPVLQSSPTPE